jgi:TM2 domain-containing membrane protein YozV
LLFHYEPTQRNYKMEAEKIDRFLMANEHKFPDYEIPINQLLNLTPEKETILENTHFKSPGQLLLISILFGFLGLDRFLIRDWGKGIAKFAVGGGLTIWFIINLYTGITGFISGLGCLFIIDWFLIMKATKRKNMKKLEEIIIE